MRKRGGRRTVVAPEASGSVTRAAAVGGGDEEGVGVQGLATECCEPEGGAVGEEVGGGIIFVRFFRRRGIAARRGRNVAGSGVVSEAVARGVSSKGRVWPLYRPLPMMVPSSAMSVALKKVPAAVGGDESIEVIDLAILPEEGPIATRAIAAADDLVSVIDGSRGSQGDHQGNSAAGLSCPLFQKNAYI